MNEIFIDTYFDNASPLRWEEVGDGVVRLDVLHDHERFRPNQQFTHLNFKVHTRPGSAGSCVRFEIAHLENCWNGKRSPALGRCQLNIPCSANGKTWQTVPTESREGPDYAIAFEIPLESECVQVARIVPYTDAELQATIERIRSCPATRIYYFGATVEGRPLEMVELGNPDAVNQVFIRARAHPWEAGTSWFADGIMNYLASGEQAVQQILSRVNFCLMPMAAKDGVYRGMTRFNVNGMDLNRDWSSDQPADPVLAPENACLQNWFSERARQGRLPRLSFCMHNDNNGTLHLAHPSKEPEGYRRRMARLETLLREMTWFTEGMAPASFSNPGTFGEGIMDIYGVDALVYELNSVWIAGLNCPPLHCHWQQLGRDFTHVIDRYFLE